MVYPSWKVLKGRREGTERGGREGGRGRERAREKEGQRRKDGRRGKRKRDQKLQCPYLLPAAANPLWGPGRQKGRETSPSVCFPSAICTSVEPSTLMRRSKVGDGESILGMEWRISSAWPPAFPKRNKKKKSRNFQKPYTQATAIVNLFPKSIGLRVQGERNPIGLVCEPALRSHRVQVQCSHFFFYSPFSNWKRMLLRKQLTFYQPGHGGGHEENWAA